MFSYNFSSCSSFCFFYVFRSFFQFLWKSKFKSLCFLQFMFWIGLFSKLCFSYWVLKLFIQFSQNLFLFKPEIYLYFILVLLLNDELAVPTLFLHILLIFSTSVVFLHQWNGVNSTNSKNFLLLLLLLNILLVPNALLIFHCNLSWFWSVWNQLNLTYSSKL